MASFQDWAVAGPWGETGWGHSLLHPEEGYNKATNELNKGWDETKGYEMPFWQNGVNQGAKLTGAEDKLLNPAGLENEWSSGYEMSPYAQQMQKQAKIAGLDAASSQGLLGSSTSLANIQQGASNIMQRDRQQYMKDLMEKYMAGIGIGQNQYNTGAQMGGQMGTQALGVGEQRGAGVYGAANAPGEMFKIMLYMAMKAALAGQG
jgi:hypothetical protein